MEDEDGSTPETKNFNPQPTPSLWLPYTCIGLVVLIGSTTALSAKFAVMELPVPLLPLIRFGGAGLCLLPLASRIPSFWRMFRQDWARLVLAGLLCVPLNQGFFLYGARLAPTTHVGLIYATCPLVVLIAACLGGLEILRPARIVGVMASVLGLLVLGLGNLNQPARSDSSTLFLGDSLLVGAVVTWGLFMTLSKPLIARHGAVPVLCGTFLTGSAVTLPITLAILSDGQNLIAPAYLQQIATASPRAWLGLAHITVVVSVFGLICQSVALRWLDASEVATIGNAAPLLTVVWGGLFLGESITVYLLFGGLLTIGGILWTTRTGARKAARHPQASYASKSVEPKAALVPAAR